MFCVDNEILGSYNGHILNCGGLDKTNTEGKEKMSILSVAALSFFAYFGFYFFFSNNEERVFFSAKISGLQEI